MELRDEESQTVTSGRTSNRPQPRRATRPTFTWVVSPWMWAVTGVLLTLLFVEMAFIGVVVYGVSVRSTLSSVAADPVVVLATLLCARFLAFRLFQWRRDHLADTGELWVRDSGSAGALVTVASFSLVGLVPTAALFPFVSVHISDHMTILSAAVAVITVPACYLLLIHYLGELSAADRYRRRYRVSPSSWHYLWTLPAVVFAWMVVSGTVLTVSGDAVGLSTVGQVHVSGWVVGYLALCAPTLVALLYSLRRLSSVLLSPLPRR
ncbi:hypothetical protein AUR64_14890 [Haloprofundus marisrubri]|uniref:Uncharacterized protein n=1 Tax=Haloprofundus marisrubri TaxID=1514971 RepID=A0A0W1R6Q5_9EURY|nr:hypothetical protein [Haloprofundus marisrubri]KTG09082.1 hypothetical protein AUR64_14890 [Haloprofundus marisrubri]